MSTNLQKYGGYMYGYSHQFIAPTEVFSQPIMKLYDTDANGNPLTTFTMVDVPTYFNAVDTAQGRIVRSIMPLAGGTHSFAPFNTDENNGEFTSAVNNIVAGGMIFGYNDFTLTGNVAYLILQDVFQNKFQYESPLNVAPII